MKNENIYYLGPKQTNIEYCKFFCGSVTLFGNSKNNNLSYEKNFCFEYWNKNNIFKQIIIYNSLLNKIKTECNIMLHDQYLESLCTFPDNVHKICCNDINMLNLLNNKIKTHELLSGLVPMLEYKYSNLNDINKNIFTNNTNLVFQKEIGSGGALTYIVNKNNFDLFKRFNDSNEVYLISEYKDNNIPLNVHCIIFRDYIEILKPSIQILELNGKIEYIDSNPIRTGSYGFFACSQYGDSYNNIRAARSISLPPAKAARRRSVGRVERLEVGRESDTLPYCS